MSGGIVGVEPAIGGGDDQPAAFGHRIARVGREIGEADFELRGIGGRGPELVGELERYFDGLAEQRSQQPHGIGDEIVDVDRLGMQRLTPRESEQAARQIGAAPGGFMRVADELFDLAPGLRRARDRGCR